MVHPFRKVRQMLTYIDAGSRGGNRPELATVRRGPFRLHIETVKLGKPAAQKNEENRLCPTTSTRIRILGSNPGELWETQPDRTDGSSLQQASTRNVTELSHLTGPWMKNVGKSPNGIPENTFPLSDAPSGSTATVRYRREVSGAARLYFFSARSDARFFSIDWAQIVYPFSLRCSRSGMISLVSVPSSSRNFLPMSR